MKFRMTIAIIALVLVFGGIFGWKAVESHFISQYFENMTPPPATVSATEAKTTNWQPRLTAVGNFAAVNATLLAAEVAGRIEEIHFRSGETVEEGELLVQLDDSTEQAELPGLRAQLKLAAQELARVRQLVDDKLVSQEQLDRAQAEFDQAQSAVNVIQAIINKKSVRAPFSGVLGIRQADLGEFAQPGTPLVSLQSLHPLFVNFTLPEQQLGKIRNGQPVTVTSHAFEQEFRGEITAISGDVDATSHNFQVQATVDNPDEVLRPGMFAQLAVTVGEPEEFVTVPRTAISYTLYGDSVYVVKSADDASSGNNSNGNSGPNLVVEQRFVELGEEREGSVAILDGIAAGERVVTAGQLKLNDGTRVIIDNEVKLD